MSRKLLYIPLTPPLWRGPKRALQNILIRLYDLYGAEAGDE